MRHHLLGPAAVAAGLAVSLAVSAAAGTAGPAAATTAAAASNAQGTARPVFLINGYQIGVDTPIQPGPCITTFDLGVRQGPSGQLQTLTVAGRTYVLPRAAVPYLGRGLDPSLFDVTRLTSAESGGRLPVQVQYSGRVPALPGVTLTGSGGGAAAGYLTPAGAMTFGAALARQFTADRAGGSYGQDGLFAGGVSVGLAGAAPAPPQPRYVMHPVTVDGTNLAGKPDTGDVIWLFNADNASRFDSFTGSLSFFYHGVAKFSVPAGHYWAVGDFINAPSPGQHAFNEHIAVLPELTVGSAATVHVDARTASSKIEMSTAKPAGVQDLGFSMVRIGATGPAVTMGWVSISGGPKFPAPSLYVSPTQASPATGTLTDFTSGQLGSPPSVPGVPYQYNLTYQSRGIIPAQRFVVQQASLATQHNQFYSAVPSTGWLTRIPLFPVQAQTCYSSVSFATRFPAQQTAYLSASPSLMWMESYSQTRVGFGVGGQSAAPQTFAPGQRLTEDWGAYPLHPAPYVKLVQVPGAPPVPVSASRAGDTLRLAMTAFSDSVPGHTGGGVYPPFKAGGSYEIDQNGAKIAGGTLAHFAGFFDAKATLSPVRSLIRVALNATQPATLNPLSTASRTVWTWWSAHEAGSTLPPGWTCGLSLGRACAPQPMMTLRYGVVGLGLDGSASPGQQVVRLSVGHLQLAQAPKVTAVAVSASFDGGKTWHAARVTGRGGSYAAVFSAPAGAHVTLRTIAADAAGGSVSETITSAYRVAS